MTDTTPLVPLHFTADKIRTELARRQADLINATHPYLATKGLQRLQGELDTMEAWEGQITSADQWCVEQGKSAAERLLIAYRVFATLATRSNDESEHAYGEGCRAALRYIAEALSEVQV